ncbi:MAG: sensor histidine kinase [Acidobacteria bacterium]|nr:sensor histidine kinase [Acidobacteriota bacterium]
MEEHRNAPLIASSRETFVESLARGNRKFYDTPDGRSMLRLFELTFEHRWIYVFELVQNALDAGAQSIEFRCSDDGDRITIQHDGNRPIGEPEVEGLSKVFRSTKGATTVGFMGIGFKSVFGRFREARVSGWGWSFRYETRAVTGQRYGGYGDVQTDPLGAVLPIWDDRIPAPDSDRNFTTRFELGNRLDEDADLRADLAYLLPDDDLTLLAILAESSLKRLDVDGCVWDLEIDAVPHRDDFTAMARKGDEVRRWQLFPVEFRPSPEAIARFLVHRHIRPDDLPEDEREEVYTAAARPRSVLGVLPLDDVGAPDPPTRGQLYATLPTEITLPFGLHINADWLLNISRTGLREIEDNPWQRDIADRIADVLASFLVWVARTFSDPNIVSHALTALALPSREPGGLEAILAERSWLWRLRELLDGARVVPVWSDGGDDVSFAVPRDVIVPPVPLAAAFEQEPALRPATLLNGPVLVRHVLGAGGCELMTFAGFLTEVPEDQLEQTWADGLDRWNQLRT